MVPNARINVTPYIDILLVLLIIFMVVQQPSNYQLPGRTPSPDRPGEGTSTVALVLSIDSSLGLSINSQPVTRPDLGRRLFELISARPNQVLFISGAGEIPFGFVAQMIDVAKGAGAAEICLIQAPA